MLSPGTVAEVVLKVADSFASVINTLLGINYILASAILNIAEQTGVVLYHTILFLTSAVEDFQSFLLEVAWCFSATFNSAVSVVSAIYQFFASTIATVESTFLSVISAFSAISENITLLVHALISAVRYFAGVLVGGLIVLLEFFPNTVVGLVQFVADCMQWSLRAVQYRCIRTKDFFVGVCSSTAEDFWTAIFKISANAYVGAAMIVMFYFLCTRTALGSYVSPRTLIGASRRLVRSVIRKGRRFVHRTIPEFGNQTSRLLQKGFASCVTRVRYWFSSDDLSFQEEETEEVGATDGAGPSQLPSENLGGAVANLRKELELEKERNCCIICQENPRTVILLPCRHMCLCHDCCSELLYRRSTCPLCRTAILSPIQVFT